MTSLAERVEQRMAQLSLRQVDVARLSQVAPASVAQWRNGRTKAITGNTLLLAAAALQCSPKWLATGMGPMEPDAAPASHMAREPDPWALNAIEQQALKIFRDLPPTGQAEAFDYLKYLSSKHLGAFKTTGSQQRDQVPGATKRAA